MFWVPEGWVPGVVEWGLAFPRAPRGSVSIQVWSFAVGQVAAIVVALGAWGWSKVTRWRRRAKMAAAAASNDKVAMAAKKSE